MNTYQWLLVLGFPPSVAAARLMPELFTADCPASAGWEESPRCANPSTLATAEA